MPADIPIPTRRENLFSTNKKQQTNKHVALFRLAPKPGYTATEKKQEKFLREVGQKTG